MHDKLYLVLLDTFGLTVFVNGIVYGDINSTYSIVSVIIGWTCIGISQYLMAKKALFDWHDSFMKVAECGMAFIVAATSHYIDGNVSVSMWLIISGVQMLAIWFVFLRHFKK